MGEALLSNLEDNDSLHPESQIIEMLQERTGIRLKSETLMTELTKLKKRYGEAPLEPLYRLRKGWFERHSPKPPKHYHRK
jgi:hypothetical protein